MNTLRKLLGILFISSIVFAAFAQPAAAQVGDDVGTAVINAFYCSANPQDGVITTVGTDCITAGGTFTFYLRGDGLDTYQQMVIPQGEGVGSIKLYPGEYEVVHEGSQTHFDMTVPANGETMVNFSVSDPATTTPWARVFVSNVGCFGLENPYWLEMNGQIPADLNCLFKPATFTFYLVGDGSGTYKQITTAADKENYIDLAPGTYEVWQEDAQVKTTVTIPANTFTALTFLDKDISQGVIPGTVSIANIVCTGEGTGGFSGTTGYLASNCSFKAGDTFTFYLVGDGTNDYQQMVTGNDVTSISLAPGTYEVYHEPTQLKTTIEISAGMDTPIMFSQFQKAQPTAPATTPVPTAPAKTPVPTAAATQTPVAVTKLPSTGSGDAAPIAIMVAAAAAGTALMLVAGLRVRTR